MYYIYKMDYLNSFYLEILKRFNDLNWRKKFY